MGLYRRGAGTGRVVCDFGGRGGEGASLWLLSLKAIALGAPIHLTFNGPSPPLSPAFACGCSTEKFEINE